MNTENYEANGYKHDLDVLITSTLITMCFIISSKKWMWREDDVVASIRITHVDPIKYQGMDIGRCPPQGYFDIRFQLY